ncbi:MAG TPA: prepilin peptidase [Patescibacteria group bacterium]|nr:prepilin peptidase [Patescibacteria group bacterium]
MAGVFGAIVGSFLNVVILRLPLGQSLGGRSHCPHCGHILGAIDLVPLLSYLALRGRCRYCRGAVSARYFIIEAVTALLFAATFLWVSPTAAAGWLLLIKFWLADSLFLAIFVIDLEHFLILDKLLLFGAAAVFVLNIALDISLHLQPWAWPGASLGGLFAAIAGACPFYLLWYFSAGRWMGFGDVKLALFLGLVLGWPGIVLALFLAFCLGGAVGSLLLLFTKKTMKSRLPFGTFLTAAALLTMFYGDRLLAWYLALLGF